MILYYNQKLYFIFLGLLLFTLLIFCVAEPNVEPNVKQDSEPVTIDETREGKSKF